MLQKWFNGFLNLFLKPNCPLCNRPADAQLCHDCERQVRRCQFRCGTQVRQEVPVFIWGEYKGALKRAITTMKYHNHPEIAQPLGSWLGQTWLKFAELPFNQVVVVPIPMFAEKQKKRGFNQAELISRSFCQVTGLPLKSKGLERVRQTEAQFGLSAKQRQENLKDAFCLGPDLRRRSSASSVLIVDDIYTTGATVQAAIQVFKQYKIPVVGVVAIATTKKY